MRLSIPHAILLLLSLGMQTRLWAQETVPDEGKTRLQVDALIVGAPDHRATLGTLEGAMALSISFGAPAWNASDHDACCRFYVKTGQSLCDAFAAADKATPQARAILGDLQGALDRVKQSTDVDANAWTMRYVFDKTETAATIEAERSARLIELGQQCAERSQFMDAADAFSAATASLHELDGQPIDRIPLPCRYAPLALSEALFGQKQYAQSAAALEEGLRFVPDWPASKVDIRTHFADAAVYKLLFSDLKDAATAHPEDGALQLLVGYHLFFTAQRDAAKPYLDNALKLNPKSDAAKRLLEEYDPNHPKAPMETAPPTTPGVKT